MIVWFVALLAAGLVWAGYWRWRLKPFWLSDAAAGEDGTRPADESLSLIIPARNEARVLPALLKDLATEGPPGMEILVIDDHSIDGTSACVREAALADSRVRLIPCPQKPDNWQGKNWAVTQGAAKASGQWLVFCDADVRLKTGTIAEAMKIVHRESLDALSLIPSMDNPRLGPAFLLACFAMSRALLFCPAAPGRRGLVQGAFLVVKRAAYDSIGGHGGVPHTLTEDIDLGLRLQDTGCRVRTDLARKWIRTRMYDTLEDTGSGLQKHLFASLSFSSGRVAFALGLHLLLFLFPFLSAFRSLFLAIEGGSTVPELAVLGMSGVCLGTMYGIAARVVRPESLPWGSVWALPLSYFGMGGVLWASIQGYSRGEIRWKGRSYNTRRGEMRLK